MLAASRKKVWWQCEEGHEWQAVIASRTEKEKSECPYCSGRYVIPGENDLQTLFSTIAAEWNYEKNGDLLPSNVKPDSRKKIWWKCRNRHEWKEEPRCRTRKKYPNCPCCSEQGLFSGFDNLQTRFPDIAEEWNYEQNNGLTPDQVMAESGQNVWWKCSVCGCEWQAAVKNRIKSTQPDCPRCAGKRDLQISFPDIAAEWNYEKNKDYLPSQCLAFSSKVVWWKCHICGKEWKESVQKRTIRKYAGCKFCHRKIKKATVDNQ